METEQTDTTKTDTTQPASNNGQITSSQPIELTVVHGEASGVFSIDERTGTTRFAEDITYEQWREVLRMARTVKKKAAIVVADCISLGLHKWGRQMVDDALEQLELEAVLVKTATAVTQVPLELRFEHLDGEHYVELHRAKISPKQKVRWARIASEQRLTPSQLRFSIVEGEVVDRAATKGLHTGIFTVQGIRQSFDVWHRRVNGLEGVKQMDHDHQVEIMDELQSIMDFAISLRDHLASR